MIVNKMHRPEDSRPLTGTIFMFNNLGCSSFKIPDGFHSLIKFLHVGLPVLLDHSGKLKFIIEKRHLLSSSFYESLRRQPSIATHRRDYEDCKQFLKLSLNLTRRAEPEDCHSASGNIQANIEKNV